MNHLDLAAATALLGWHVLQTKAGPTSEQVPLEVDPENPYSLPSGNPIATRMDRIFRAQREEIRGFLRRQAPGTIPLSAPSLDHYRDRTIWDLSPRLASYRTEAAQATARSLGLDPRQVPDQRVAATEQAARIADQVHTTTRERLQAAFSRLRETRTETGRTATPSEVRSVVEEVFRNALEERSGLIARTETSDAVHSASLEVAAGSGRGKSWALDGRPCPVCIGNAGAGIIPIEAAFPSGHIHPTAHPRCACSIRLEALPVSGPVLPRFGPSLAPVTHPDHTAAEIDAAVQNIFGRPVPIAELSGLVGAPDDSRVVASIPERGFIHLVVDGSGYHAERSLTLTGRGGIGIENRSFEVDPGLQGRGLGTAVFGRQVENSVRLGIDRISTYAVRDVEQNGYYTWSRFGYDGPIPYRVLNRVSEREIPAPPGNPQRISDLMRTPEGRDWWRTHGDSADVTFDLAEGSLSRQIWDGYLIERANR